MVSIKVDTTSQVFSGSPQPDPDICLIHTTEVWAWPGYRGGLDAPQVTVKPIRGVGIEVRVHRPPTEYGRALVNAPGGVLTNTRGVWQIELIGTCDPSRKNEMYFWPEADDVVLEALAEFMRPTMLRFDIPAVALAPFLPYPQSYGNKAGQRLTFAQWNTARGICGHQHAPENDHGDPGAFPVARLIGFITKKGLNMPLNRDDVVALWNTPVLDDTQNVFPSDKDGVLTPNRWMYNSGVWSLQGRDRVTALQREFTAEVARQEAFRQTVLDALANGGIVDAEAIRAKVQEVVDKITISLATSSNEETPS